MELGVRNARRGTLTVMQLRGISFIFFFAQDAFRVVIATVFPFLPYKWTVAAIVILMYTPLFLSFLREGRSSDIYVERFLIWLVVILSFFLLTYFIHPEYKEWYFSGSYPIWDKVFRPNQYLYAMLFVSAIREPDKIIRYIKIAAYILLAYYTYRLFRAQLQGYWITTTTAAGPQQTAYDLSYGYDQLLVFSIFFCCGFREKKILYFVLSGMSLVGILLGGSRGPLLGVALMGCIMYMLYRKQLNKTLRVVMALAISVVLVIWLLLGIRGFTIGIGVLLSNLGFSSRTTEMLASGISGTEWSGRNRLYEIAWDMVKNGFWGYGAYGDRYVIGRTFWVGYTHNIFFEFLIDFGWVLGGYFCIKIIWSSVKMVFFNKSIDWRDLFIIFMVPCTKLLLSGSFWYSAEFWSCIMIYSMYRNAVRNSYIKQSQSVS